MSGRIPASSQASRELSTASLTVVRRALRGLSKPRRWRFLAKNSETEMSRCLAAMDSAVARGGAFLVVIGEWFEVGGSRRRVPWDIGPSVAAVGTCSVYAA